LQQPRKWRAAEATRAVAVPGTAVSTAALGLVTAFGERGVMRAAPTAVCVDQRQGQLHFDLLDAALTAALAGDAAATRWLRNVRAFARDATTKHTQLLRVPGNASGPELQSVATDQANVAGISSSSSSTRLQAATSRLTGLPPTLATLASVLPALLAAREAGKDAALCLAAAYAEHVQKEQARTRTPGTYEVGVVPICASPIIDVCTDNGDDVIQRGRLLARTLPELPAVPRPFADAEPAMLSGVLTNFYWPIENKYKANGTRGKE